MLYVAAAVPLCLPMGVLAGDSGPARVAELEDQILAVAGANIDRVEDSSVVRAELEPLIAELLTLRPAPDEAVMIPMLLGGWHNLWSNQPLRGDVDLRRIYQVVLDGYYYNISRIELPAGGSETSYLRGAYVVGKDVLAVEFTDDGRAPGWLGTGTDLGSVAVQVESGAVEVSPIDSPAIGVTGVLDDVYVSDDLRIVRGSAPGMPDLLFVLERSEVVAPAGCP